jgi:cobalt-zinc-cadmium efflux system outer membrane protein
MDFFLRGRAGAPPAHAMRKLACAAVLAFAPTTACAQGLQLQDALRLARDADPGLAAAAARIDAAGGALRQAQVKPNPVIGLDVENFAGTGPYSVLGQPEATLYYQQLIERGDKRGARTAAAQAELDTSRLRRVIRGLDLFRDVQRAWAEAVASEAAVQPAQDQLTATQSLRDEIARRVAAARDPRFASARVETQVAQAEIALEQARASAQAARAALTAYWGGGANLPLDLSAFEAASETPASGAPTSPDLAVLEAERNAAAMRIRVEETRAVQDVTLRGGVRYLGNGDEVALVVGGSMPIGINDANQGNIERARAERMAAEQEITAARLTRARDIATVTARMAASAAEARRLQGDVLPRAQQTVTLVREGFNRGGFSYIDVLEAERVLVEIRARRIAALKAYQLDRAALDRLTGRHAPLIADQEIVP